MGVSLVRQQLSDTTCSFPDSRLSSPTHDRMTDISDEQLEELKLCFDIFDRSGGKEIVPSAELQAMLQSMKLNPLTRDVKKIIADTEMEGKDVDFPTFVTMYDQFRSKPTIATMEDMFEAFKTMDREGNGNISGAMLRNVVTIMGDAMR